MTAIEHPPATRPPGPSLRLSILLIVVGLALAIPTTIAGIIPIVRAVSEPRRFDAPGIVRVHLDRGEYLIYEDVGSNSLGSAFSTNDNVSISPADVTVTDANGTGVEVRPRGVVQETLAVNGERYVGAVRFTTPGAGTYTLDVSSPTLRRLLVARPFGATIRSALGWFGLALLGGIVAIVGIILLIVGSVRRNRVRNAFAYPGVNAGANAPPGWHPDPWAPGKWRWWDGSTWTEHSQ